MYLLSQVLSVGVGVAVACMLVAKYNRTHDTGLLWLGVLLVVWPFALWCIRTITLNLRGVGSTQIREAVELLSSNYSLLPSFGTPILALIAVACLHRAKSKATEDTAPPPLP